MRAVQVVVFQAVVGWCTSKPREALLRYSWQESLLSARGLGEWRFPLGALQAGVSTALLWWACMSGAPASTGLVWGHQQFVSPPSCSASFGFRVNLTPERDLLETDQQREQLMKPVHVRGRGCVAWSPFGLGFMFLP